MEFQRVDSVVQAPSEVPVPVVASSHTAMALPGEQQRLPPTPSAEVDRYLVAGVMEILDSQARKVHRLHSLYLHLAPLLVMESSLGESTWSPT
jgi:hypothetical protein